MRRLARRQLTAAAAAFALLAGTALAVPQTRDALFNGFGAFKEFLTDGGDPPGTPIPTTDNDATLNWFRFVSGLGDCASPQPASGAGAPSWRRLWLGSRRFCRGRRANQLPSMRIERVMYLRLV